jgi:peptidoglycan hydrolase-like protein with peptidoglycan-binding domain
MAGALLALVVLVAAAALAIVSAQGSLSSDSAALAKVGMPLGGGTIQSVSAVTGPHAQPVPVEVRGNRIWPRGRIRAGELISIEVVIKRPGWIAWLAGGTERLRLSVRAPTATVSSDFLTLASGAPLRVRFDRPVSVISSGPSAGELRRQVLGSPSSVVTLPRPAVAGTVWISAAPRTWETAPAKAVSWFPGGAATAVVASPAPGTRITPSTAISLTFSKPVAAALGSSMPPVSPNTPGTWRRTGSHTIVFHPSSYGYGLGATVTIALPRAVSLVGGHHSGSSEDGTWTVPPGSTVRLQQLLAKLGYLPLTFSGPSVAPTPSAQESAAVHPSAGTFSWRYGNEPAGLRSMWSPGTSGVMTRGAVMAFENDHGIASDGVAGPEVWRSLIASAITGHGSSFGYTFVSVSEAGPESLTIWHNGRNITTVPVNTGIASAPTALGTYPVFEHISSGTMSGTNPDGSHYNDPGIPWISYFNGGDALHGFYRAQYGFPQSLGCVEMTVSDAGKVWPYTPIGTLVHVA